jgi:hypothetical protein
MALLGLLSLRGRFLGMACAFSSNELEVPTDAYAPGGIVSLSSPECRLVYRLPTKGGIPKPGPYGRRAGLSEEGQRRMRARFAAQREIGGPYDNPESPDLAERYIMSFGSNAGPPMLPNFAAVDGRLVGAWQGDTLVVETTNIHARQNLGRYPSTAFNASENIKVME